MIQLTPKPKKGCDAGSQRVFPLIVPTYQATLARLTTGFFATTQGGGGGGGGSCTLVLDETAGSGTAAEIIDLFHARLSHTTNPLHPTARVVVGGADTPTTPQSAHHILREILYHLTPTTPTNGYTYHGLLQVLAQWIPTPHHQYPVIILEVRPGLAETPPAELTALITDLKKIQTTHPSLAILVTASPHHALPPTLFTATVTIPDPSPTELKNIIIRSVIPSASEEIHARIAAYAYKLRTHNVMPPNTTLIHTATTLAAIVRTLHTSQDTPIPTTTVTHAFHALIGRTIPLLIADQLTQTSSMVKPKPTPKSALSTTTLTHIVAAAIHAHTNGETVGYGGVWGGLAGRGEEREVEKIGSSITLASTPADTEETETTRWIPIPTLFHHLTPTTPYPTFTTAIPPLIAAKILVAHPVNSNLVALNPILADSHIIPHLLTPQTVVDWNTRTKTKTSPPPQTTLPEHHSHIALLAAIIKTEQMTPPSLFPTHRSIYNTYRTICARFDSPPQPLHKIYRAIQSLKKHNLIHVHRAHATQGRPNQLLHKLSPNTIAQLRATIHTITHPHALSQKELDHFNATIARISATTHSRHKQTILAAIAAITQHSGKAIFNASNAYDSYSSATPNPIPKHTFLSTIRQLINDNIFLPLYRTATRSLTLTIPSTLFTPTTPPKPPP